MRRADAIRGLRRLPDGYVDLLLTDPPYGITDHKWDTPFDLDAFWFEAERVIKPGGAIVVFASGHFTFRLHASNPRRFKAKLTWQRSNPTGHLDANRRPMRTSEDILIFGERMPKYRPQRDDEGKLITDVIYCPAAPRVKGLTPKPAKLLETLIRMYSDPGDTVYDPFMGSGTTIMAAMRLGRIPGGTERDRKHYRMIQRNLTAIYG